MKNTENPLGDFIRSEISAAGKRQVDVARVMNIPTSTVNGWVRTGKISRDHMAELSKVLKKDLFQAIYNLREKADVDNINHSKWVQIIAYHISSIQLDGMQLPPSISAKWTVQCFDRLKNKPIPEKPFENQPLILEIRKILKTL